MNNRGKGDFRCDRLRETEHSVLASQNAPLFTWKKLHDALTSEKTIEGWSVKLKMQQTCQRKVDTFAKIVFYVESRDVSVVNAAALMLRCCAVSATKRGRRAAQ